MGRRCRRDLIGVCRDDCRDDWADATVSVQVGAVGMLSESAYATTVCGNSTGPLSEFSCSVAHVRSIDGATGAGMALCQLCSCAEQLVGGASV